MVNKKKSINKVLVYLVLLAVVLNLSTSSAFAGTDGAELQTAYDKILGLFKGMFGKLLALTSFVIGTTNCVVKFNPYVFFGSFGTALATGVVPYILDATITAIY
jgi:type IV secretory pathway VirB2 component (pilin)